MIRAVIFDMDGLLLDTEPIYRVAWQKASAHFGRELTDVIYARLAGRNRADAERMLSAEFGADFPMEAFKVEVKKREETEFSARPIPKKSGVDELLSLLERRNIPRAVATSSERERALRWLAGAGLLARFAAVTTGDEVADGKPAPDIYLLAAKRLGVASEDCLVLEDAEPGIRAARAAGMTVYHVPDMISPTSETARLANGSFDSLNVVAHDLESKLAQS